MLSLALITMTMYSWIAAMFSALLVLPRATAFKGPSRVMFGRGGSYLIGRKHRHLSPSISTPSSMSESISNTHLHSYTIESTTGE